MKANQCQVVLVDDDDEDIWLTRQIFARHYPQCDLASYGDGVELLEALSSRPAQELPNLIVLDLNMPRMNGFETLRVLKSDPRLVGIPVLVLTTSSRPEDAESCQQLGSSDYVAKDTFHRGQARQMDRWIPQLVS